MNSQNGVKPRYFNTFVTENVSPSPVNNNLQVTDP